MAIASVGPRLFRLRLAPHGSFSCVLGAVFMLDVLYGCCGCVPVAVFVVDVPSAAQCVL